jgi:Lipase (class 3)
MSVSVGTSYGDPWAFLTRFDLERPQASEVASTAPDKSIDLPLAQIASDAYLANGSPTEIGKWQRLVPDGDQLLDVKTKTDVDIDPRLLEDEDSGFRAGIYSDGQGHYVVGFAGTNPEDLDGDVATDGLQAKGWFTRQYELAAVLARQVQDIAGDGKVTFTGHSLGGGLAAEAALATRRSADSASASLMRCARRMRTTALCAATPSRATR